MDGSEPPHPPLSSPSTPYPLIGPGGVGPRTRSSGPGGHASRGLRGLAGRNHLEERARLPPANESSSHTTRGGDPCQVRTDTTGGDRRVVEASPVRGGGPAHTPAFAGAR